MRVILSSLMFLALNAWATPEYETTSADGYHIVLHSEKCKLSGVSNLPWRATSAKGGRTTEGCYAVFEGFPIPQTLFFWADKRVSSLHAPVFKAIQKTGT